MEGGLLALFIGLGFFIALPPPPLGIFLPMPLPVAGIYQTNLNKNVPSYCGQILEDVNLIFFLQNRRNLTKQNQIDNKISFWPKLSRISDNIAIEWFLFSLSLYA